MSYHYSDPDREADPHALPNVEVFQRWIGTCHTCEGVVLLDDDLHGEACSECGGTIVLANGEQGWFYAFGFPGCLNDSEPSGPYDSESEALDAARELASE